MADPFVGEIRIVGFNFSPTGWAFCDGQLIPIAQNTALFSLLGTMYGGNGTTHFALPNLQGRVPLQAGQGPGLTQRDQGVPGGSETVTLVGSALPPHSHPLNATTTAASATSPAGALPAASARPAYGAAGNNVSLAPESVTPVGGDGPHNNMQPYLTLNCCIALQGIYPSHP
jgi:microcystin-dependent protein